MAKRLEKYISSVNFHATDDELRELCPTHICVYYAFDSYANNLHHIMDLASAIKNEYPNIQEKDMTVWFVNSNQSRRHVGYTTLYVPIPIEDYLRMRHNNEINIL